MDIEGKKIWQVAAGNANRKYPDLLLKWDVVAIGSGEDGWWPEHVFSNASNRYVGMLRQFCEAAADGDLVVLRVGVADIYGVGELVGDYLWLDDFGDIDNWDLQHVRRVRWLWKYDGKTPMTFPVYTLKFGPPIQELNRDLPNVRPLLDWLCGLDVDSEAWGRDLKSLPQSCVDKCRIHPLSSEAIGEYLFDSWISPHSIDALLNETSDLVRVAKWYRRTKQQPSEHETIAYLAAPLLRALGWTPQKMAIEWKFVDIALFDSMPRSEENLAVVVEAKTLGSSSLMAWDQGVAYCAKTTRTRCSRMVVTDGIAYAVYLKPPEGSFSRTPSAYLNLTRMMETYPILGCRGATAALEMMAPDWNSAPEPTLPADKEIEDL